MTNAAAALRLVRPDREHLAAYLAALDRGRSPDNLRGAAAANEQRALALMLDIARGRGMASFEVTTDPDNLASQRVIERNGGRLVEVFDRGAPYGRAAGWRYRIEPTQASVPLPAPAVTGRS